MSKKIRVAILDDHQSIVDGYLYRLQNAPDIEVVATAVYGEALETVLQAQPIDVLILDVDVPTSANNRDPFPILYVIPQYLYQYPSLHILVISMHNQKALIRGTINAGACGYILKDDRESIHALATAIRAVADGGMYFSRDAHHRYKQSSSEDVHLTKRQLEVLSLCAAFPDETTAQLSDRLQVAESTVRNTLSQAYVRLGVSSRTAAVAKARRQSLITPQDSSEQA